MVTCLFIMAMAITATSINAAANLTALFGSYLSPSAKIILPNSSNWTAQVVQRWTDYEAPNFIGAIKPATERDIQETVKIAQSHSIAFLATGGGHAFSDYSQFTGISIDLGNFNSTHFDDSKTYLTVGGGVIFSDLFDLLYEAKKELPVGSCACPGVVGATLSAGLGPFSGFRGLLIDALESVRLVTAFGSVITVSKTQHPDLFWAIRGAGSNFGVITSATFKVYDITNDGQAMTATLGFPGRLNGSFWKALKTFDKSLPAKLALTNVALYDRNTSQPLVGLNAIYFGSQEDGMALLAPFVELGPIINTVQMTPQNQLFPPVLGSCDPNQHINIYSVALTHINTKTFEDAFNAMSKFWVRYKSYQGRLLIQRFSNEAVLKVPSHKTAFPWRSATIQVSIEGYMTDTSIYGVVAPFEQSLRDMFSKTSGYDHLATYTGYAHGDEGPMAWYSLKNLPRLSALKMVWDPKGLFVFNKPIPTPFPL